MELLTDVVLVTAGILGAALLVGVEFPRVTVHRSAGLPAASPVISVAREEILTNH